MNIVFASLDKIDTLTKFKTFSSLESFDHISQETIVVDLTEETIDQALKSNHTVFLPSTKLQDSFKNVSVYFDLEVQAFFQKAKELILNEESQKGVLRFRRMVNDLENASILTADLFVLSSVFGEPLEVDVKRAKQSVVPSHIILTVKFAGGTLAHLEFTFGLDERIEFEWSGVKNILEFNSKDMEPLTSPSETYPSLSYLVETIVETSHRVDEQLLTRIESFTQLLTGGVKA